MHTYRSIRFQSHHNAELAHPSLASTTATSPAEVGRRLRDALGRRRRRFNRTHHSRLIHGNLCRRPERPIRRRISTLRQCPSDNQTRQSDNWPTCRPRPAVGLQRNSSSASSPPLPSSFRRRSPIVSAMTTLETSSSRHGPRPGSLSTRSKASGGSRTARQPVRRVATRTASDRIQKPVCLEAGGCQVVVGGNSEPQLSVCFEQQHNWPIRDSLNSPNQSWNHFRPPDNKTHQSRLSQTQQNGIGKRDHSHWRSVDRQNMHCQTSLDNHVPSRLTRSHTGPEFRRDGLSQPCEPASPYSAKAGSNRAPPRASLPVPSSLKTGSVTLTETPMPPNQTSSLSCAERLRTPRIINSLVEPSGESPTAKESSKRPLILREMSPCYGVQEELMQCLVSELEPSPEARTKGVFTVQGFYRFLLSSWYSLLVRRLISGAGALQSPPSIVPSASSVAPNLSTPGWQTSWRDVEGASTGSLRQPISHYFIASARIMPQVEPAALQAAKDTVSPALGPATIVHRVLSTRLTRSVRRALLAGCR